MSEKNHKPYIIILDPMGDAQKTGRIIYDTFERGLTLQCAETIKYIIENSNHNISVIITRLPGDIVYELQNASLANRLNADLFVSINFYATNDAKPTMHMYHFSYGDTFPQPQEKLTLYSYDQAYKLQQKHTQQISTLIKKNMSLPHYQSLFTIYGPFSLPVKQLIGVVPPAIILEMGLKDKNFWHTYAEIIADTLINTITEIHTLS